MQVEIFNITIKKYPFPFIDETNLYLISLMVSYNVSYYSTIASTPLELLFGVKLHLPFFPIQTFSASTTTNCLLWKDSSFCKNYASWPRILLMLVEKNTNQWPVL
jgi:hypothetical protein